MIYGIGHGVFCMVYFYNINTNNPCFKTKILNPLNAKIEDYG